MNKSGKNNCDGKLSRKKWHTHMSMQATLGSIGKRRHFKGWIDDVGHLKIEIEESTKYAIGLKKERITIINKKEMLEFVRFMNLIVKRSELPTWKQSKVVYEEEEELDKRLQSDYRKMMRKYRYWKK